MTEPNWLLPSELLRLSKKDAMERYRLHPQQKIIGAALDRAIAFALAEEDLSEEEK